jgi:hypothetical protein
MSKRLIIGGLLILCGFFIGYHAITIIIGWQYRNQAAFGVASFVPYLELSIAVVLSLIGLWLLFKRRQL